MLDRTFDEFWKRYPRKIAKHPARQAYDKALKAGADPEAILRGLAWYIRNEWADRRVDLMPHASTFLNQRRFEDVEEVSEAPESREVIASFLANLDFDVSHWANGVSGHGMNGEFTPHMQHFARKVALDKKLRDVQVVLACCTSYAVRRGWAISTNGAGSKPQGIESKD